MERCKQSVNVIKLSHLFTIWPPLPKTPSTLCPLSLLLSGPLYHSFKIVVALKPLANVSMSLFRAGQGPASQLPPGCSLIDGPPLGEWQAALVGLWWASVTAGAAAGVSPLCWAPGGCWAPGIPQLESWPSLLEPGQSNSLVCSSLHISLLAICSLFLQLSCKFPLRICRALKRQWGHFSCPGRCCKVIYKDAQCS